MAAKKQQNRIFRLKMAAKKQQNRVFRSCSTILVLTLIIILFGFRIK